MIKYLFFFVFVFPFFSYSQNSDTSNLISIMEGFILTPAEEMSEVIKLNPVKTDENYIFYFIEETETTIIKSKLDGGCYWRIPYSKDILEGLVEQFLSFGYEYSLKDKIVYFSKGMFTFHIETFDDEIAVMGIEFSNIR